MCIDLIGFKVQNEKQVSEIWDELQLASLTEKKRKYEIYKERKKKETTIIHKYTLFRAKLHSYTDF